VVFDWVGLGMIGTAVGLIVRNVFFRFVLGIEEMVC
jgi:hypothetical protein